MLKDTAIVTLFLILSSVLGFIAQIVFVSSFGASIEMDIYFSILSIPTIITGMAPIVFASVLLPNFAKYKTNESELNQFIHSLWIYILIFAIVFSGIGCFLTIYNLDLIIPQLPPKLKGTTIAVCLMVWIGSGLSLSSGFFAAVLNYNKQFIKVAWTSTLPALSMIIFTLILHKQIGIRSISLGFVIAYLIQFFVFFKAVSPSLSRHTVIPKRISDFQHLLSQTLFVILSLLPFTVIVPLSYYWASFLPEGSTSYLGYSQSFAGFLSVATGMGIAIVSFPDLADSFAKGSENGNASLFKFEVTLKYVLLFSIFAAAAFISLRIPILTLFYQRGSFTIESVQNLSTAVPWYLIAAIFAAGLNLLRTLFYSKGEFRRIAILGLVIPIIFFILAGVLKDKFSFVGIGIANALSFGILFFVTVYFAKNKSIFFLTSKFLIYILKNAIIVLITGVTTAFFFFWLSFHIPQIAAILVSLFFFTGIYFLIAKYIFQLKEVKDIATILVLKFMPIRKS